MNRIALSGRLTKEPETTIDANGNIQSARYTLAVRRIYKKDNGQDRDLLPVLAFGKNAEFAKKYLHKDMQAAITGHVEQSSFYTPSGDKIFAMCIVAEEQEFFMANAGF